MSLYKVSAIISAYYAEDYIDARLQNLIDQDAKPEIVVVCQYDSPEHKAAHKFREDYPHIVDITTPDVPTVYDAWNIGIKASSGEYLTNANTDDRHYPGALSKLAADLDRNTWAAASYFDVDVYDEDAYSGQIKGRYEWAEGDLELLCLQGCFLGPMPMWRRSLHDKHGLFDEEYRSAGDYEFWMRIADKGEKFHHIREALGGYADRKKSVEHRLKLRALWETSRAKAKYRYQFDMWRPPNGNHERLHNPG